MNDEMNELTLNDGTVVKLETKLNIKKMMMINKDFDTDEFAKMSVGGKSMDISVMQGAQAVYVAYRQANMTDYMSFYDFIDQWDFDMGVASTIYNIMMFKKARDAFQQSFDKQAKLIAVKKGKK